MKIETICAEALPVVTAKLTEDLLPQLLRITDWHRHSEGAQESLAAWWAALAAGDSEALEASRLEDVLALARRIQFAAMRVSHSVDLSGACAVLDLDWSGDGDAVVAMAVRKHLRVLVVGRLGDAGLDLVSADQRAEDTLVAQVRGLVRQRLADTF